MSASVCITEEETSDTDLNPTPRQSPKCVNDCIGYNGNAAREGKQDLLIN